MKTNIKVTKKAFAEWFADYADCTTRELTLIAENNLGFNTWRNFILSRRVRAHGLAFEALCLSVSYYCEEGFEASNEHIKKLCSEITSQDYKEFLAPVVEALEAEREKYLKENA